MKQPPSPGLQFFLSFFFKLLFLFFKIQFLCVALIISLALNSRSVATSSWVLTEGSHRTQ